MFGQGIGLAGLVETKEPLFGRKSGPKGTAVATLPASSIFAKLMHEGREC
jgi:hypothetical protein